MYASPGRSTHLDPVRLDAGGSVALDDTPATPGQRGGQLYIRGCAALVPCAPDG